MNQLKHYAALMTGTTALFLGACGLAPRAAHAAGASAPVASPPARADSSSSSGTCKDGLGGGVYIHMGPQGVWYSYVPVGYYIIHQGPQGVWYSYVPVGLPYFTPQSAGGNWYNYAP